MFFRPIILATALALPTLLSPTLVAAQDSTLDNAHEAVRFRGTVEAIEGAVVTLAGSDGETTDITMSDDYFVFVYRPITVAELEPGDFLSVPSITGPDGAKVALSINVFPEEFRGVNEGVNPWDIEEGSLMTNATIGEIEDAADGNVLKVTYLGESEDIVVPETSPITRFAPEPGRKLEVGESAIILGTQAPDGSAEAGIAGVNEDGTLPVL